MSRREAKGNFSSHVTIHKQRKMPQNTRKMEQPTTNVVVTFRLVVYVKVRRSWRIEKWTEKIPLHFVLLSLSWLCSLESCSSIRFCLYEIRDHLLRNDINLSFQFRAFFLLIFVNIDERVKKMKMEIFSQVLIRVWFAGV